MHEGQTGWRRATRFIVLAVVAVVIGLGAFVTAIRFHLFAPGSSGGLRKSVLDQQISVADRRVVDRAFTTVERFLRTDPHEDGPKESEWVKLHGTFGDFVGWAKTDSPDGAYLPGTHCFPNPFGGYFLVTPRDAIFEKGAVKIVVQVESATTPSGGPEVSWLTLTLRPMHDTPTCTVSLADPNFVSH